MRLFFLHGTVVVHKHECAFIIGIGIALRALVPGAKVALWIVVRQGGLGGALLRSSLGLLAMVFADTSFDYTYCQGRLVRWGETKIEDPRRGLYLRWEISSRTFSMVN